MKAIDTEYAGKYFRSRTEARWAVFFDAIGVKWEYELEGYELGDHIRYLPDFWFPEYKFFGEVKPTKVLTGMEKEKMMRLAKQSGYPVALFAGQPNGFPTLVFEWREAYESWDKEIVPAQFAWNADSDDPWLIVPFGAKALEGPDKYDPFFWDCDEFVPEPGSLFDRAIRKANMYRFEFK